MQDQTEERMSNTTAAQAALRALENGAHSVGRAFAEFVGHHAAIDRLNAGWVSL
jgi:hypothetical protein